MPEDFCKIGRRWMKILWVLCVLFMLNGCSKDNGGVSGTLPPPDEPPVTVGGSSCAASYVRYGDFLSTQMVTNRTFGYGMFISEFQAADGPTCSTFWLYANEPSVRNLPGVAQNWRWNEIDFEFVPYTEATQSQYYVFDGGLPTPLVHSFGTEVNFGDPRSQNLENREPVTWKTGKIQTDETIARDMWLFYNTHMAASNGGPPTGGHFILKDDSTQAKTIPLAWNATAESVKTALDALNGGQGLFNMKGKYTVSSAAAGAKGNIVANQNVIRNLDPCDVIDQLSAGEAVKAVEKPSILPDGTTTVSADKNSCTVTLSKQATEAVTAQTFQFIPVGSWSVTFTGADRPALSDTLIIDASQMEPAETLGKVVIGWADAEHTAFSALSISVFQPSIKPAANSTWWELLRDRTGDGKIWPTAQTWKYPLAHIQTPAAYDMKDMVTLNFWRSPKGNETAEIDFGKWGKVAHTGILRERPIPGTVGHDRSFTSAVLNNEAYVFDSTKQYKPTQSVHTYTIVWTPKGMAQYIDAPDRGRDISNAKPIAQYGPADFPSLDHSGPQAEGALIPWIGTELNQPIGNVTMNVANYVAFRAASTGNNNYAWVRGSLAAQNAVVSNVDFQSTKDDLINSLAGKGITGEGIPLGTTIVSVDKARKTITMNKNAAKAATAVCITMGQDIFKGSITKGNSIITGLDAAVFSSDKISVGQIVRGDGIPDGATIKEIDKVGKKVTMTTPEGATKTVANAELTFQTAASGAGWSGLPPAADFSGADAYVRSLAFFPLKDGAQGTSSTDFVTDTKDKNVFWLDFSDGTWTEKNFNSLITKYFSILYAQDYTSENAIPSKSPLRDSKSPMNVTYTTLGGKGVMKLRCSLSEEKPKRNFFVLQPKQMQDAEIGAGNPLVRAEITSKDHPDQYYAVSSSVTTPSAFYAPPKGEDVSVQVKVWVNTKGYYDPDAGGNPVSPNPDYQAEILLKSDANGNVSWEATKDDHHVIEAFQSVNPHLITVKAGQ